MTEPEQTPAACTACAVGRRDFLRDAMSAAAALAGLSAMAPRHDLSAMSAPTTAEVKFYQIPGGDYVAMYGDDGVILCRHDNIVYAFHMGCPDPNAGMYIPVRTVPDNQGRIVSLECPRHQVRFALNGRWQRGGGVPNLGRMRIWVSQENNNYVGVDTGDVIRGDAANREAWQEYQVVLG
jgi:hypothetical protein